MIDPAEIFIFNHSTGLIIGRIFDEPKDPNDENRNKYIIVDYAYYIISAQDKKDPTKNKIKFEPINAGLTLNRELKMYKKDLLITGNEPCQGFKPIKEIVKIYFKFLEKTAKGDI